LLAPCKVLEKRGFEITYLKTGSDGIVSPLDVQKHLRKDTILISIIYANNKIGTIQPIKEIGKIKGKVCFHTDATQATNFLNLKVETLGIDLLTANAHKIYGPKGIGVLYKKSGVQIMPQIFGGGHEEGLRSGTPSTPLIVGMAKSLEIAQNIKNEESLRLCQLRDYFIDKVLKEIPIAKLNGHPMKRLPNNANFSFLHADAESIIIKLDVLGVSASSGSACEAQYQKDKKENRYSVRFSLGRQTNKKEIDEVLKVIKQCTNA
ncbi:MAG: aminotransferase class V-fold PLP-dependent enzyme, partial [Patescibacteria group bacterium]